MSTEAGEFAMRTSEALSVCKIDKDLVVSKRWHHDWKRFVVEPVCEHFGVKVLSMKVTPSVKKGFHVRIFLNRKLRATRLNEIEYLLGDDCQRVSLNRARIKAGLRDWDLLFVTPNMNPYAKRHSCKARLRNWFNRVLRRTKPRHKR